VSTYETTNNFVAAYLNYAGVVLLEIKRTGPKSFSFVFEDESGEAAQLEADFWNDRKVTSARELLKSDREIRTMLRDV